MTDERRLIKVRELDCTSRYDEATGNAFDAWIDAWDVKYIGPHRANPEFSFVVLGNGKTLVVVEEPRKLAARVHGVEE